MRHSVFALTVTLLVVGVGGPPAHFTVTAQRSPRLVEGRSPSEDAEIERRRKEAYREGGFKAAAAVTGTFVSVVNGRHGNNADSLEFLTTHSPVIVVGSLLGNRTWLNALANEITTDYEVFVEQSLKGAYKTGDKLTMSVNGGKVGFEDGSSAEVRVTGMVPPFNGERYVLFLRPTVLNPSPEQRKAARGPILAPSFQSLSLYKLTNGAVSPKAFSKHPLAIAYGGKPEQRFLDDIFSLVEHEKDRRIR
jgi:hypothetical protein